MKDNYLNSCRRSHTCWINYRFQVAQNKQAHSIGAVSLYYVLFFVHKEEKNRRKHEGHWNFSLYVLAFNISVIGFWFVMFYFFLIGNKYMYMHIYKCTFLLLSFLKSYSIRLEKHTSKMQACFVWSNVWYNKLDK